MEWLVKSISLNGLHHMGADLQLVQQIGFFGMFVLHLSQHTVHSVPPLL